ncbi:MAG: DUF421 domain-containing protein [Actinomycetota bacterium]
MAGEMFVEQIPLAEKILRTVVVYALIVVLFRLTGKRGLAILNTFDLIVTFLLSNVVQNAVIGKDNSLLGGMVGAVTLVSLNVAVNRLIAVNATDARIFEGRATTVISDGHILNRAFRHLRPHRRRLGRGHAGAAQSGPAREAGRNNRVHRAGTLRILTPLVRAAR